MTRPKKTQYTAAIDLLSAESKRLLPGTYEERQRGESFLRAAQFLREQERREGEASKPKGAE